MPVSAGTGPGLDTDTIIIGNGPSAMILSYILHGHIPFYSADPPHPDPLLHAKLQDCPQLLRCDFDALTDHFEASRFSYSTQALPVNVLLDTLVRPNSDTDDTDRHTNVQWRYMPNRAVPHLVFGNSPRPGGQWTDNPTHASWDIQTLSYAGMLSLPGYSFADHHRKTTGKDLPPFTRPTRRQVADYLLAYPAAVGIDDVFRCGENLSGISRTENGFYVRSHGIRCKHLVLASGIFSEVIRPSPLLQPLTSLSSTERAPRLVIGSGFSAADVIISAPKDQKIIHIFRWDPENRPSPLRSCHQQAYPEYAGVYRLMKRAALSAEPQSARRAKSRRITSTPFLESRCWDDVYEGLPNTEVIDVHVHGGQATVTFRRSDGSTLTREVGGLAYTVGRRGSLSYLDNALLAEVLGSADGAATDAVVSGQTLRAKATEDLEVAPDVFIIGSLTGDSLIRFAYGGCVYVAGKLICAYAGEDECTSICSSTSTPNSGRAPRTPPAVMNGIDGHHGPHVFRESERHLDRREEAEALDMESPKKTQLVPDKPRMSSWWTSLLRMLR